MFVVLNFCYILLAKPHAAIEVCVLQLSIQGFLLLFIKLAKNSKLSLPCFAIFVLGRSNVLVQSSGKPQPIPEHVMIQLYNAFPSTMMKICQILHLDVYCGFDSTRHSLVLAFCFQ